MWPSSEKNIFQLSGIHLYIKEESGVHFAVLIRVSWFDNPVRGAKISKENQQVELVFLTCDHMSIVRMGPKPAGLQQWETLWLELIFPSRSVIISLFQSVLHKTKWSSDITDVKFRFLVYLLNVMICGINFEILSKQDILTSIDSFKINVHCLYKLTPIFK